MGKFRGYDQNHAETMRLYCRSLLDDHRRRYAACREIVGGR
jgi:hypothetical protein